MFAWKNHDFNAMFSKKLRVDVSFFVLFHLVADRSRSEGFQRPFGNLVALADRSQEEGELSGENLICVDSMG